MTLLTLPDDLVTFRCPSPTSKIVGSKAEVTPQIHHGSSRRTSRTEDRSPRLCHSRKYP